MFYVLIIVVVFVTAVFVVTVELMVRKGKLKPATSYSYKGVFQVGLISLSISVLICLFLYLRYESLEGAISLFVFLSFCTIGGCLKSMLTQKNIKARGGKKE